jgi:uncharacterized protein
MPSTTTPDPARRTQPLADAEFEELGKMLAADWAPETTLDLEQLDGLLAGLICAPRIVLPGEYAPAIFGDEEVTWPDRDTAQRFHELLMRRWNEITIALNAPIERLDDPRAYVPFLFDWDENAETAQHIAAESETPRAPLYGELWARGFLRAVELTRDDCNDLPDVDEQGAELVDDALADILALVPQAAEADEAGSDSAEERDDLVANAIVAAYDLRQYWRDVSFERARVKEPIRRAPKVGRNEPCPCGSGKKFKNCHGRGH